MKNNFPVLPVSKTTFDKIVTIFACQMHLWITRIFFYLFGGHFKGPGTLFITLFV